MRFRYLFQLRTLSRDTLEFFTELRKQGFFVYVSIGSDGVPDVLIRKRGKLNE